MIAFNPFQNFNVIQNLMKIIFYKKRIKYIEYKYFMTLLKLLCKNESIK